jgi:hypothetical protein
MVARPRQYLLCAGGESEVSFSTNAVQVPLIEHATRLEFAGSLT